jgi:predicted nucleic acid-binding protein
LIVIDASVLIEVLLRTPLSTVLEARLLAPGETLHAPHLIDIEVAQVLRRYERSGAIDARHGRQALDIAAALPIRRYAHNLLLGRVWDLRHNLTAYDGAYVALAELLGATLLTRDAKLAGAPGHAASAELV